MIYLDNAATTLIKPDSVAAAAIKAMKTAASPGRGSHEAAARAAMLAYECREEAASLFHTDKPENIVFCMNATHALNIAIKSIARAGDTVVISGFEHNAVTRPLHAIGAKTVIAGTKLFDPDAAVSAFDTALKNGARLAIINHVSNVFGFIQPVEEIAEICRKRKIPFIIDASQSAGALDINFDALGADFIGMPGHKGLYGPQGTGLLLCRNSVSTLIEGGTGSNSKDAAMPDFLPDRLEAGTHNIPGIAGLTAGIKFVRQVGTDRILKHERKLLKEAVQRLQINSRLELYTPDNINGRNVQSGVLSFNVTGLPCEIAAEKLSEKGIAVRAGIHCAPTAHMSAGTIDKGTVRISFSVFNTSKDVARLAAALDKL
jgi:cysteine desulfurase family protein